jgi:hypothetical protein
MASSRSPVPLPIESERTQPIFTGALRPAARRTQHRTGLGFHRLFIPAAWLRRLNA